MASFFRMRDDGAPIKRMVSTVLPSMAAASSDSAGPLPLSEPPSGEQEGLSEAEAHGRLAEELIYLKNMGKLSTQYVCSLMWWAKHAGPPTP